MKYLPLEKALEEELAIRGLTLSERMYGEDIRQAAQIDDTLGEDTVDDLNKKIEGAIALSDKFELALFGDEHLSRWQKYEFTGSVPFFIRTAKSETMDLTYESLAKEPRESYKEIADDLITSRHIDSEYVEIYAGEVCIATLYHSDQEGLIINSDVAEQLYPTFEPLSDLLALNQTEPDYPQLAQLIADILESIDH